MDSDLTKTLERLEVRKRTLEHDADLSSECQSVLELDNRIASLLNETKSLKNSVEIDFHLIEDTCNGLSDNYNRLKETSETFEMVSRLMKLNKICKQIDVLSLKAATTNATAAQNQDNKEQQSICDIEHTNFRIMGSLIEEFEIIYNPLEAILSKRPDLPYEIYANKVAEFKRNLDNATHGKKSDGST